MKITILFKSVYLYLTGKESWSKVGSDAKEVIDPKKPTMSLGLWLGDTQYNKHIVTHEFGHALGLEHEHQRSMFWSFAEKHINGTKMSKDIKKECLCNYLEQTQEGDGTSEYDPDSVMHYW